LPGGLRRAVADVLRHDGLFRRRGQFLLGDRRESGKAVEKRGGRAAFGRSRRFDLGHSGVDSILRTPQGRHPVSGRIEQPRQFGYVVSWAAQSIVADKDLCSFLRGALPLVSLSPVEMLRGLPLG
jgi:hypothetical protein